MTANNNGRKFEVYTMKDGNKQIRGSHDNAGDAYDHKQDLIDVHGESRTHYHWVEEADSEEEDKPEPVTDGGQDVISVEIEGTEEQIKRLMMSINGEIDRLNQEYPTAECFGKDKDFLESVWLQLYHAKKELKEEEPEFTPKLPEGWEENHKSRATDGGNVIPPEEPDFMYNPPPSVKNRNQ